MSLSRGSHSNCGSQPSGWEPFFFTLKQPALVFSSPRNQLWFFASQILHLLPLSLCSAGALVRRLSRLYRGLAVRYAYDPVGLRIREK